MCLQICSPPQTQSTSRPLSTFQERFYIFTESELLTPLSGWGLYFSCLPGWDWWKTAALEKPEGADRGCTWPQTSYLSAFHIFTFKDPSFGSIKWQGLKTNPGAKLWWSNQIYPQIWDCGWCSGKESQWLRGEPHPCCQGHLHHQHPDMQKT